MPNASWQNASGGSTRFSGRIESFDSAGESGGAASWGCVA